ncbi:MAG: class I SAM-dependent methyltransferase [Betaproteobacteria bacterium]
MNLEAEPSRRFTTYGKFKGKGEGDESLFKQLFPNFDREQEAAANEIVERLLRHCDGHSTIYPRIRYILDLGCGDGSLLVRIKKQLITLSEKTKDTDSGKKFKAWVQQLQFHGIDSCADMIELATENCDLGFTQCTDFGKEWISSQSGLDPDELAILCLSHTWFHLRKTEILSFINEINPAMVVVDVFESWDHAIAQIPTPGMHFDEEFRPDPSSSGSVFCLRTHHFEVGRVHRGIFEHHLGQGAEQGTTGIFTEGKWIFRTTQECYPSAWLWTEPDPFEGGHEEAVPFLENRSNSGILTGGEASYIVLDRFHHPSGWGAMNCTVLLRICRHSKDINEAYSFAGAQLVKHLLYEDSTQEDYRNLRKLVDLFGRAEAAVILPFDRNRVFAKFTAVKKEQLCKPDNTSPGHSPISISAFQPMVLVSPPLRWQHRYPVAYGLYHTLLHPVSSPIGVMPDSLPDYHLNGADEALNVLETAHLNRHPGAKVSGEKSERAKAFFILPVYFGALPIFALVLEEPPKLSPDTTGPLVFMALAQDIRTEIERHLTEEFFWGHLALPFLANLLSLGANGEDRAADSKWRETRVDQVIANIKHAVTGQPWKSWVHGLATIPLWNSVKGTSRDWMGIQKILKEAKSSLLSDKVTQISMAFARVSFFSGNCHDNLMPEHDTKFEALEKGYKVFPQSQDPIDQRWQELFEKLVAKMKADDPNGVDFNDKNKYFWLAKKTFCRTLENRGTTYRFNIARLYFHVIIPFQGTKDIKDDLTIIESLEGVAEDKDREVLVKAFHVSGDPTERIGKAIRGLVYIGKVGKNSRITINLETGPIPEPICFTIRAEGLESVTHAGGTTSQILEALFGDQGLPDTNKFQSAGSLETQIRISADGVSFNTFMG